VLWFVFAILVLSSVHAGVRGPAAATGRAGPGPAPEMVLAAAAVAIAVGSLLVWQFWPWNSTVGRTARLGEWPQGAVLFTLGIHAGEHGWLERLPRSLGRRLG
jgi:glucans biosynthesis protein C